MPTLDWLNRASALTLAARVPYRLPEQVWARKSQGRCLFGQIAKERDGVGMSGQLDTLLK